MRVGHQRKKNKRIVLDLKIKKDENKSSEIDQDTVKQATKDSVKGNNAYKSL